MQRYLEWLRVKNYSECTVENREAYLTAFLAWCTERGIARPADVTRPILERYQRMLFHYRKPSGKPLSFRSQHSRLVPVRAYFKWLTRQNVLLATPASELELPRLEKRLPKHVLTAAGRRSRAGRQPGRRWTTRSACATAPSWRRSTPRASGAWR